LQVKAEPEPIPVKLYRHWHRELLILGEVEVAGQAEQVEVEALVPTT